MKFSGVEVGSRMACISSSTTWGCATAISYHAARASRGKGHTGQNQRATMQRYPRGSDAREKGQNGTAPMGKGHKGKGPEDYSEEEQRWKGYKGQGAPSKHGKQDGVHTARDGNGHQGIGAT